MDKIRVSDLASCEVIRGGSSADALSVGGWFDVECVDANGAIKWRDTLARNLVVEVGRQHILDLLFVSATTQIDPWYVGLTDGTPSVAAGDTLASHVGWAEVDDYTGDRKEFVDVRTGQQVTNSASPAEFTIGGTVTVGGLFIASVATTTTGTLLAAAAFTGGDRTLALDDVLRVTYTLNLNAS